VRNRGLPASWGQPRDANEGKPIAVVPPDEAERVLSAMRSCALGRDAAIIGQLVAELARFVTLKSPIGGERVISLLAGEQLPRMGRRGECQ
jgi:hydrogenase expression/formation protein HypE